MDKWESFPSIEESVKMDKEELWLLQNRIKIECRKMNCVYLFARKQKYNIQEYWESAEEPTIEGCIEYLKEKNPILQKKQEEREMERYLSLQKRMNGKYLQINCDGQGSWVSVCGNPKCCDLTYYLEGHSYCWGCGG